MAELALFLRNETQEFQPTATVQDDLHRVRPFLFRPGFKWLFVLTLTGFNFAITYSFTSLSTVYIYFFLSDLLLTYLTYEFYILSLSYFDRRWPWQNGITRRLTLQLTAQTFLILLFVVASNEFLELLVPTGRLGSSFYTFDLLVIFLLILLMQFIYISTYFVRSKTLFPAREANTLSRIKVSIGKTSRILKEEDLLAAFVDSDITFVLDKTCKKFISDQPLKQLENEFSSDFFRANRQYLIHKNIVTGFKSLDYGKILVDLDCELPTLSKQIVISRKKAAEFRSWINDQ